MDNNLNQDFIKKYSHSFSEKVASAFFPSHDSVNNDNIMEVQSIKQVNLFVIKNLLDKWLRETERLKSPYFDYSSEKVREAMGNLQNVLSRNISIDRIDFMPLLMQSVEETLLLIFSPYDYYNQLINTHDHSLIATEYLERLSKYIKINPHILKAMLNKLNNSGKEQIHREDALLLLNEVIDKLDEQPADVEPYVESFSSVEPLTVEKLYSAQGNPEPSYQFESEKIEDRKKEWKSLHEELMDDATSTLAEIHRQQKINNIQKHLTINQRFMFVNTLFGGSEDAFNSTIDHIEKAETLEKAMNYLKSNNAGWDLESEEVGEFIDIVRRRHA